MSISWVSIIKFLNYLGNFSYCKPVMTRKEQKENDKKLKILNLAHQKEKTNPISYNIRNNLPP